jgi:hypothetical protein
MTVSDFHDTIDIWISELEAYDFETLTIQPGPGSWSVGQVYMHILDEADFQLGQITVCLSSNADANGEATREAKKMFEKNSFPNLLIEGPPSNAFVQQPESKEHIKQRLMDLKRRVNAADARISASPFQGKAMHPGLHYLSAREWLQFSEMHFRHHLRQKARLDAFLADLKAP